MPKSQDELRREWLAWRASKGLSDGSGINYSSGVSLGNVRISSPRQLSNTEQWIKATLRAHRAAAALAECIERNKRS